MEFGGSSKFRCWRKVSIQNEMATYLNIRFLNFIIYELA